MALVLSGSIDISGSMTATTILISSPGAAGMVSSSAQITELAPLMAYTASLKGAAIVSSSQQITNYYKFAETASANTFYGNQSIIGTINGDGMISTSDIRSNNGASDGQVVLSKMGGSYYGGGTYYAGDNGSSQSGFRTGMYYFGSTSNYVIERSTNTQSYGALPTALTYTPAVSVALATGDVTVSTGNLIFSNGKGIDFSATANSGSTTTSELLNDYEEGTWTPTDGSGAGLTFTTVFGRYIKIGKQVTVHFRLTYPSTASGATVIIGGLPYVVDAGNNYMGGVVHWTDASMDLTLMVLDATSTSAVRRNIDATDVTNANLSTKTIRGTVTYQTF